MDATALLTEGVRELVRRGAVDPAVEPEAVRSLLDRRGTAGPVWDAVAGFGPLQRHPDAEVEEIRINGRLTAG